MFEIRINVANIKIIVHVNELNTMLDYTQESKWMEQDEKRNEVMIIRKRIGVKGKKKRKENEGEK